MTETTEALTTARSLVIREIAGLTEDAPPEQAQEMLLRMQFVEGLFKELKQAWRDAWVTWLRVNGQLELEGANGPERWYLAKSSTYKLRDGEAIGQLMLMEELLNAAADLLGGDLEDPEVFAAAQERAAECLSVNAFKPGACKAVLGEERFRELFRTEVRMDPKTGKPLKGPKVENDFSRRAMERAKKAGRGRAER